MAFTATKSLTFVVLAFLAFTLPVAEGKPTEIVLFM